MKKIKLLIYWLICFGFYVVRPMDAFYLEDLQKQDSQLRALEAKMQNAKDRLVDFLMPESSMDTIMFGLRAFIYFTCAMPDDEPLDEK